MANSANAFAVASGHDQTVLNRMVPQPHTDGMQYPGEVYTPATVAEEGEAFVILRLNNPSPTQVAEVYANMGITSAKVANVTISLPTNVERTTWADYNGQAVRPRVNPWDVLRYGQVEILVRHLEAV